MVRLVGPLRVDRDGTDLDLTRVGSRKARTLLQMLGARHGELVSTMEIAQVLWPSSAPADPPAVVASLVSRLRRNVGPGIFVGGRHGYRLGGEDTVVLDVTEARRLVVDGERELAGAPALAATAGQTAARWIGTDVAVADQPDAEWAEPIRSEVVMLRRRIRLLVARSALAVGDLVQAHESAASAHADDPVDEEAVRLLMMASISSSEPGDALRTYDRFRRRLAAELGTEPASPTRDLHLAALQGRVPSWPVESSRRSEAFALAGRAEEMAILRAAWASAAQGRSSCVLISGEAGIGKTRLLHEISRLVDDTGGIALSGRCFEAERSLFAQPVADALGAAFASVRAGQVRAAASAHADGLARLVPEIGPLGTDDPPGRRSHAARATQVFAAVAGFLRALSRDDPVLLALDDLHLAGSSTLQLLHYVARHTARSRLLLVATLRDDEGRDALATLGGASTVVGLDPLPRSAVAQLARNAGQESRAAEILHRTGGHPLFVVETLRSLATGEPGLPHTLRDAVTQRVVRTGPATERLLRSAAVLGSAFDPGVAARLVDVEQTPALRAFERALSARLVVTSGSQYQFAHDLVREAAAHDSLPDPAGAARPGGRPALRPAGGGRGARHGDRRPCPGGARLVGGRRACARAIRGGGCGRAGQPGHRRR